ncbi:vezatin [Xenopus tropicalis]|uniref:Vezatin n=1 Tax=Xenopus tropicalis TaxID=8364 RepID=VEZA_XENTR|nr:vezatin [Xenopus tropicalis]Q28C41.1 RecName: Full=Vezatin [Xenopus tropicalis]AAI36190.1 Vezatin [Xenopus tropicalis]CAJ81723.1 novel protein [Xenopus tropicalis]|eukprot:NP_001039208.1 vezatin [Xenopus tropicalis]
MTAEFDEEVVFENSPLFQYLQDLGQTDFEICPLSKEEEHLAGNGHGEQDVHTTEKKSNISRTVEFLKSWSPLFSKKKRDEKICLLENGFRLESLRTILQQEVLIQEDVELIELLDPGILSAGQTQNQQNGHLPTLWSIATPNIWEMSVLFAFLSALAALQSWSISSSLVWGPSLILFAAFTVLRALHTWRSATLRMILRKYCNQVEGTVLNSRAFTNLVRKALRLIQETEVISRGFTLLLDRVSAACPYGKAGQHASQHLLGLRKAVYRTVRTNFRISRLATLYMLKHYPLNSEIDNVTNYICVVPLKDLGLGLCEEHVSEEEAHNLTDAFSLPALKVLFQLWIGQSSEFFRRLALLLSPENAAQGHLASPEQLPHLIWSDVVQDLPHTQAACLAELKRSYEFYRYFETQHQSGFERTAKRKKEVGELSNLHGAVRSLQLHLKALLNEVIILEDELEKLSSCKEMQAMTQEASLMLEEKLRIIQPHVQASNTCWEEALCQVGRMVRRPAAKKDIEKSSCENLNFPVVSNMPPALRIEDRDPVPEEQILEAYVEEAVTDQEFNSEDIYLFSPEERERQKREREESKRVLQELKAVLGLKASEAERQKWKQLLFSEHAVITPFLPEEPVGHFEPPDSVYPEDPCKNLGFYGEFTSEINGTEHAKDTPNQGDLQMNMNHEDEAKICPLSEEAEPESGKDENESPCPVPRTVLPPAIKERLARIHQTSDLNFTSGLAAQVAARSLTFTFLQEQTFGDEWDDDDDDNDNDDDNYDQVKNVESHEKERNNVSLQLEE